MRFPLSIVALLITCCSYGQSTMPTNSDGKYEYAEIVKADSSNAQQLYSAAKQFFATAFVSGKDVTQLADDQAKTIVIKYVIPVSWKSFGITQSGFVKPTLNIQMKDGKYRYSVTDFVWEYQAGTMGKHYNESMEQAPGIVNKKQWSSVLDQVDQSVKLLISQIKKSLADKSKSDW